MLSANKVEVKLSNSLFLGTRALFGVIENIEQGQCQ